MVGLPHWLMGIVREDSSCKLEVASVDIAIYETISRSFEQSLIVNSGIMISSESTILGERSHHK